MEMIKELKPNQVFVFGSNLAGRHGKGAARQAYRQFGARLGFGEGLFGQSYAFPTLTETLNQRCKSRLESSRDLLYKCCEDNPDKEFLLTKVGCGLAGYEENEMRALFVNSPKNLVKPEGW